MARISPDGPVSRSIDGAFDTQDAHLIELERKIEHLERAVASQRLIGIAIGLLAQRYQWSTTHAWEQLRHLSQVTNIKVRDVARILRDAFDELPSEAAADVLDAIRDGLPDEFIGSGRS